MGRRQQHTTPAGGTIVVVGGIKGGVSKTTTALNLAVMYAKAGLDVKLVDFDGSNGAYDWTSLRREKNIKPTIASESMHGIKFCWRPLDDLRAKHDLIICDGGGFDSQEFRDSLQVADVLITPTRPYQVDFNTLPKVDDIIETAKPLNQNDLRCFLYLTQIPNDSKNQIEKAKNNLRTYMGDSFPNFAVLNSVSTIRNTYPECHSTGMAIVEFARSNEIARKEMRELFEELTT